MKIGYCVALKWHNAIRFIHLTFNAAYCAKQNTSYTLKQLYINDGIFVRASAAQVTVYPWDRIWSFRGCYDETYFLHCYLDDAETGKTKTIRSSDFKKMAYWIEDIGNINTDFWLYNLWIIFFNVYIML